MTVVVSIEMKMFIQLNFTALLHMRVEVFHQYAVSSYESRNFATVSVVEVVAQASKHIKR